MAKEIERKFLVREEILIPILQDEKVLRTRIAQFYLVATRDVAVRLRKSEDSDEPVVLAVKHGGNMISTNEHEFPVPFESYDERLADRVGHEIVKTRHYVWHGDREWEVDVFEGELAGLIVAELECDDAAEVTDLPEWAGEEVTFDRRYKNAVLALEGKPDQLSSRIANNKAVLEALRQLDLNSGPSEAVWLDGAVLGHMTGSDDAAPRELRSLTLNPFSSEANDRLRPRNIITIEDPPEYVLEAFDVKPLNPPVPNAERQNAFEQAMSDRVRADPDQIMRADPPFHIFEKPLEGLTEGLMFAPGDAVFTDGKPSDESTVEGNGSIPEEGVLLHVANSGHAATVSPHAAEVVEAFSGISEELAATFLQATESHRYIDQSQEFNLIGEVTDESSADLLKRAAAEGSKAYGKKED
jgi:CYTH domain-containing protein